MLLKTHKLTPFASWKHLVCGVISIATHTQYVMNKQHRHFVVITSFSGHRALWAVYLVCEIDYLSLQTKEAPLACGFSRGTKTQIVIKRVWKRGLSRQRISCHMKTGWCRWGFQNIGQTVHFSPELAATLLYRNIFLLLYNHNSKNMTLTTISLHVLTIYSSLAWAIMHAVPLTVMSANKTLS